ncbi:hypothetical protein ACVGWT_02145, partial [Enterobacter hormaechei]
AMAWLIFYKHPRDQKKLSTEERDYINNGQETQHQTHNSLIYTTPSPRDLIPHLVSRLQLEKFAGGGGAGGGGRRGRGGGGGGGGGGAARGGGGAGGGGGG